MDREDVDRVNGERFEDGAYEFQVVADPARWVRAWTAARADAARMRLALDAAGLTGVCLDLRGEVDDAGEPELYLGRVSSRDALRLIAALPDRAAAPDTARRQDGAA